MKTFFEKMGYFFSITCAFYNRIANLTKLQFFDANS
jgi:hypothetical protein